VLVAALKTLMEHPMNQPLFQVPTEQADTSKPQATPPEQAKVALSEAVAEAKTAEPNLTPVVPHETARQRADREAHEATLARVREFEAKVRAANASEEKPHVPQPVAPAIVAQTKLEMETGAAMNKHHEALKVTRPPPVPNAREQQAAPTSTPVFRPADGAGSKDRKPASLRG
jgi:hypothetical protein